MFIPPVHIQLPHVELAVPATLANATTRKAVLEHQAQKNQKLPAKRHHHVHTMPKVDPWGGGINQIPGVPASFVSCVAYRESTDLQNPAANGNAYGIIPASGYNVEGSSLSHQKQIFALIYHTSGPVAWAADGCPGT
jgi:hypothetical protein